MAFAQDDPAVLWSLFEYQYLNTSLLSRLLGRSRQVLLRRLRELRKLGFVNPMDTSAMSDNAYTLGKAGWEFIAHEIGTTVDRLPFSKHAARSQAVFWKHTILVNSVRLSLTQSAIKHDEVVLHRFIPEWEQVERPYRKGKQHKHENYLLWERLEDKKNRRIHDHRPDGCFLVGRKGDSPDTFAALFLEADRGTEDIIRKINAKYSAYRLFFNEKLFFKNHGAGVMRVLFVLSDVTTNRRIKNMERQLQKVAHQLGDPNPKQDGTSPASFVHCFRFCRFDQLSSETAWEDKVWEDWKGEKHSLFNASNGKKRIDRVDIHENTLGS